MLFGQVSESPEAERRRRRKWGILHDLSRFCRQLFGRLERLEVEKYYLALELRRCDNELADLRVAMPPGTGVAPPFRGPESISRTSWFSRAQLRPVKLRVWGRPLG